MLVRLVLAGASLAHRKVPDPGRKISEDGIVSERRYYPGYHLVSYLQHGALINPYVDLGFAARLEAYAKACGPITIHSRNPGTLGYLAVPQVSIIDTLGLTDAFIARLSRDHLVDRHPRPGHPDKRIPVRYLAGRRDVSIVPGWRAAVDARDCTLPDRTANYLDQSSFYTPPHAGLRAEPVVEPGAPFHVVAESTPRQKARGWLEPAPRYDLALHRRRPAGQRAV